VLNQPEPACLVIADITGYTGYLAGAELDHAQDILADLIGTVVGALRPTFRLSKLEGDAAFVYAITESVDGSALQDAVERCYFAFRRRLRDIGQASQCECNACTLIPSLDLKFVAHHGRVVRQRIMGREELAGADVIVAHRLLKNSIAEALGFEAYAFYSEACVVAMGLVDPVAAGLVVHEETYEHLGLVRGWVRDLHEAWRLEAERTRLVVEPDEAAWSLETLLPGPPPIAWEWVTSPARRPKWQHGVNVVLEDAPNGRRGLGTTNHCVHGRDAIVEEIVDWRPYDYFTLRVQVPMPGELFEAVDSGTRHTIRILRPRSARERAFLATAMQGFEPSIRAGEQALIPMIAADVSARSPENGAVPEPEVPTTAARFLTDPVREAAVDSGGGRSSST
jgi:hypothetical protein